MKEIIDEIKTVPGIIGACVFSPLSGIVANNLPAIFKEQRLLAMGKMMTKFILAGRKTFSDLTETSIFYEESALIIRELFGGTYLLVMAEPGFNASLLTMTLNLSLSDMDNLSSQSASFVTTPIPAQPVSQVTPQATGKKMNLDEMLMLPDLGTPLGAMQTLLAKVIGPMAQIIFRESVEDWSAKHSVSHETLPALVKILNLEIGDEDKIAKFEQLISAHLSPGR